MVCGSMVSCSLFRPKDDEDTWGDPHWQFENGEVTQASARSESSRGEQDYASALPKAGADKRDRRLVASSRDVDYWPTTQELEARGGSLTIEDYSRTAHAALHGTDAPAPQSHMADEPFSLNEPEPPLPPDNDVDPLAGFWDDGADEGIGDGEDHTDDEIQRAGADQGEPFIIASEGSPITPDDESDVAIATAQQENDAPVLVPIPPSSTPLRNGPIVGSARSSAGALDSVGRPDAPKVVPEVVLLDSGSPAADGTAFDGVSLLTGEAVSEGNPADGSLLDQRRRVSITEMDTVTDGPLLPPSFGPVEAP